MRRVIYDLVLESVAARFLATEKSVPGLVIAASIFMPGKYYLRSCVCVRVCVCMCFTL